MFHEVLNPEGVLIRLPSRTMKELRVMGLLRRNSEGLLQIKPQYYDFVEIGPATLHSILPRQMKSAGLFEKTHPQHSFPVSLYNMLGRDCSGPSTLNCDALREELDRTPPPRTPVPAPKLR